MGQASLWAVNTARAPGKRRQPTIASPKLGGMIEFVPFRRFIRGMSDYFMIANSSKRQRRLWDTYGLRDHEYLRLKVLTCMLPALCNCQNHPLDFLMSLSC